jgi:hypothetical protein
MHRVNARTALIWVSGAAEGLLIARLVLRLFAARPDNPVVAALIAVTEPLRWPLAALDVAQPQFGAVLEISTLSLVVLLPALAAVVWRMLGRGEGVRSGYR